MFRQVFLLVIISLSLTSIPSHSSTKTIGILVFDGVLSSDITAPVEVFGTATKQSWFTDYEVKMISVHNQATITTAEGLTLAVDSHIGESHKLTTLILPSAYDMEPLLNNKKLIKFIQKQSKNVKWLASNCSGAYLLAESGLLNGRNATTWYGGELDLQKKYPDINVQFDKNYVIDDNIITSNGSVVSYTAGIKLLSLMSSDRLAKEVFDALQLGRLVNSY